MRRRTFVSLSGMAVFARPMAAPGRLVEPRAISTDPFTLGVASGDPGPRSILLWTRLAPDPLGDGGMPGRPAAVDWQLASDPDFSKVLIEGQSVAWAEYGHAVKVRLEDLRPATQYFYRFRFGDYTSRAGTFRTAPRPDADVPARFGVVSCNRYEDGWYHAFRHLAEDNLDFIFHAGDYIYEKRPKPERMRAFDERECITLDDYRRRYARYRMDEDLQRLHARVPFVGVWDDHEVAGNWAGRTAKHGVPDSVFSVRRAAAFQAWWEAMPFAIDPPAPGAGLRQYRTLSWGRHVHLIQLDTRQYRADQSCGDETVALCSEAHAPDREMLGRQQSRWLGEQLAARPDAWRIVGQSIPSFMLDHDPGEGVAVPMDKWVGYPHAWAEFEKQLAAAAPVVTLAGDLHGHYAAARTSWESNAAAGADFVTSSVTSGGDGREHDEDWPVLQAENPALKYHSRRRGYLLIDADSDRLQADFRILDSITSRAHKLYSDARATVTRNGRLAIDDERQLLRRVGVSSAA